MSSNRHDVQCSRNDSYFLQWVWGYGWCPCSSKMVEYGRWWAPWQLGGTAGLWDREDWKEWKNSSSSTKIADNKQEARKNYGKIVESVWGDQRARCWHWQTKQLRMLLLTTHACSSAPWWMDSGPSARIAVVQQWQVPKKIKCLFSSSLRAAQAGGCM